MNKSVLLIEHTSGEFIISRLKLGLFLIEKGYQVSALVPEGNQEDIKKIEASGIKVFTFPYERNMTGIGSTLKVISLFRKLFKKHQFDIIHSFKFQPNFYAALARLFLPKNKLVLHITGLGVVFTDTNTFKIKLLRFISRVVFLFCFIVAEKLIFQNPDDEKDLWLTSFFKGKHSVIQGSGVNIEKFDKRKYDVKAIRQSVGVEEDKLVLTFISRLVQQKGIYEVVAAVQNLSAEFPKMRLHVVGNIDKNSPESITQDFIDKHQNENINFLGRRKDIAELLAITDLYVFPSYYREGLPRTCLEALATGLPIITTNMPGCNLCIDEGQNGYLIETKSVEKVEKAIRKICVDNSIERMGLHSRKIAEERFQNKLVYQQVEKKYREIFANPS